MKRITKKTYRLKNFFSEEIWQLEMEELSRAKALAGARGEVEREVWGIACSLS